MREVHGHDDRVLAVAFSPDGKTLASENGGVTLWQVSTGQELLLLEHTFPVTSLAFSPDGKVLALLGRDRVETVDLDALTNALIMSLNLDVEEKQKLLELSDVAARAEEIGSELSSRIESLRFLSPYRRSSDPTHN